MNDEAEARIRVLEVGGRLLTDQIAELAVQTQSLPERMAEAMDKRMRMTLTSPEFHAEIRASIAKSTTQYAAEQSGRFMGRLIKGFLLRLVTTAVVVLLVAKAAGLHAATQVFHWLIGDK